MALLIIGFSLMGLTFGPMGALLPELFPTNVRYTGSAIGYNVSSILGAAVAPFIAVGALGTGGGSPVLVGVYLAVMAVLTLIALLLIEGDEGRRLRGRGRRARVRAGRGRSRGRVAVARGRSTGRMPRPDGPRHPPCFVLVNG